VDWAVVQDQVAAAIRGVRAESGEEAALCPVEQGITIDVAENHVAHVGLEAPVRDYGNHRAIGPPPHEELMDERGPATPRPAPPPPKVAVGGVGLVHEGEASLGDAWHRAPVQIALDGAALRRTPLQALEGVARRRQHRRNLLVGHAAAVLVLEAILHLVEKQGGVLLELLHDPLPVLPDQGASSHAPPLVGRVAVLLPLLSAVPHVLQRDVPVLLREVRHDPARLAHVSQQVLEHLPCPRWIPHQPCLEARPPLTAAA